MPQRKKGVKTNKTNKNSKKDELRHKIILLHTLEKEQELLKVCEKIRKKTMPRHLSVSRSNIHASSLQRGGNLTVNKKRERDFMNKFGDILTDKYMLKYMPENTQRLVGTIASADLIQDLDGMRTYSEDVLKFCQHFSSCSDCETKLLRQRIMEDMRDKITETDSKNTKTKSVSQKDKKHKKNKKDKKSWKKQMSDWYGKIRDSQSINSLQSLFRKMKQNSQKENIETMPLPPIVSPTEQQKIPQKHDRSPDQVPMSHIMRTPGVDEQGMYEGASTSQSQVFNHPFVPLVLERQKKIHATFRFSRSFFKNGSTTTCECVA